MMGEIQAATPPTLSRRLTAEAVGTAFLLAAVIGSGIMAERLFPDSVGLALLANTIATGAALVALILTFGRISGAHFNPAVSVADALEGGISWREAGLYLAVQIAGGCTGAMIANLMFAEPAVFVSIKSRSAEGALLSEFVATFGLLAVIWGCVRLQAQAVAWAVGLYITSAYWFTASTSFANPAVTIARTLSDSFAGIRPADVPGFVLAQFLGAVAATLLFRWLVPSIPERAAEILIPHPQDAGESGPAAEAR